ncbi:ESPR-type extended signal peptide-containing protein [Veillonella magna]|uniref:ESPR-type extended signal peptide-containing protein n=1 Tax=Veillonella magna TaxID=464322 RepID=UPI0026DA840D|nr:ESPR-type extended signal peptide-containing protein [Veillonella magna]
MNKIFKVVWSKTKNCYVVTSELAKNHTKNNQTKAETSAIGRFFNAAFVSKRWNTMTVRAVVAVLALTGLTGITFNVSAADTDANTNPTSEHFVSVNFQPTTTYSGVAFNKDYKTFATNVYTAYVNKIVQYETAIAQNVYNGTTTDAATLATYATDLQKYETDLLNLGYNQTQINNLKVNNIKGITRTYDNGKLILTVDANAMKTAYADANTATGAVTSAQSSDTDQTAIDTATTTMLGSSNYDNNQAIGKQSIAIGFAALADGSSPNAVALGANTQITDSDSAVALGANNAIQKSKGALAMGNNVTISNSSGAIVFGDRVAGGDGKLWAAVTDNAKESVAIGLNAYTSNAPYAVAIGSNARAYNTGTKSDGQESVAIGYNARTRNMSYSIALGSNAQAEDTSNTSAYGNSIAIGRQATANTSNYSIAIGSDPTHQQGANATGSTNSIAIGHKAKVTNATDSIAFGREANANGKTGALAIGSATTANSDYSISMGYNTKNNGTSSIAIGNNVQFANTSNESIVIGNNIKLEGGSKTSTSSILIGGTASDGSRPSITKVNGGDMNYSVVIGAGARVSDALLGTDAKYWIKGIADETVFPTMQSVTNDDDGIIGGKGEGTAVGNSTWASGQAAAFGNNAYALGRSSIAIGNDDNAAYYDSRYNVSTYDAEHYYNSLYKQMLLQKSNPYDVNSSVNGYILDKNGNLIRANDSMGRIRYSPTMAVGQGSMAIGSRSMAYADNATAIGALTFAIGKGSTALGTLTRAEGAASMAMGNNSYVFANNAIASGSSSQVLSEGGNAYGYRTYAGGKNSLAVGSNAYANVKINFGTKDGHAVFDANGLYNSDPSRYAKSILTGKDLKEITANDDLITADGLNGDKSYLDNLDDLLTADTNPGLTTAKAETTTFHGVSGVVVAAKGEDDPNKNAENSIVIGNNAIATAGNAIAMGKGAIITDDATNGMALGSYSMTTGRNSVALGLASRATGINSMAVGTASSANAENALSVGIAAINEGKNSSVIGFSSGVAHDSENSIIFGTNSVIDAGVTNSIVIGTGSSIGRYLMDDGHLLREINTEVGGVTGDSVESFKQVKTDENKKIDGAMAIGVNARVYNAESTTDSTATTRTSEEGKTLARENGNNAMAIGNGAEAWLENSVALGVNSETDYTPEQMAMVAWRTPGAVAASTDVNTGIISIGKKGMERRLVNVAAGAYDTDAVNVSQLMQLWDSIQREMNPIDLNNGVHFVATNFQQINSTPTTDYATKYGAQVTYDRFIRTLSEYKGYLIKAEYGGSTLTDKANTSYRKELTQLRNDLVNTYGISLDQLNADSKLSNFYGTLTENTTDHLLQVNLDADGLHAKFDLPEYALQDLVKARDADISVLTQDGNYITGMTSDALTAKLTEINYDNSQALTEGSIAIGYNARVGEKTTDNTGATAIKGQKGGVAIGYEARNMAETDNLNGASVALGDKSIVTEADATTTTKGVYYTNEAKDGITATPNAGVVSVGTSAETKTADGITYNPSTRRIINVAAGALDTDAVNVSQLKSLAAQTIKFTANGTTTASGEGETATTTSNAATDAVKVGTENGMNFSLKGADNGKDITTTASGTDVTFTLNKATTVTGTGDDADKAVTSGAVNTAITTVKNTINALDGRVTTNTSSIGTLNDQMAHTIGVTGNTTPAGTSNAKSLTTGDISFAINGDGTDVTTTTTATGVRIAIDKTGKVAEGDTKLVTGDTVNTAITNAKNAATTTLTEHADSPVTVTKTTAADGHFNYNVTFNGTKAAEQIPLTYKANGTSSTTTPTVMLSDGLNFISTDNLTASVEANGVVKYTLNKALTGISSISNTATSGDTTTGTTITLSPTSKEVNVGGAKITGLANGSADSDAVTYGQFSNRKISLKGNSNSSTTEKTLANDVSFNIVGAEAAQGSTGSDITTAANGDNVTITLNKATSIASGNTQVATSGQVYDAVTKAKTKVAVNPAENGILTVTNTPGEGTAADTYTLSINQKTLESNTQLSYQASGDRKEGTTLPGKTSLATGLNFKTANNNLTATTDTDGVVTYGLSSTLTDITSITGPKGKDGQTTTMTFGGDKGQTITLTEGTKLTGLADGENGSDAVNVSQLDNLKNKVGAENAVSSKTDATPGAAGKDGLDGKDLGTQIAAIREGEAGPMIYTDGEGNRVVKDGDNLYTKDSLAGAEKAADGAYYNTNKLAEAGAKIENGKVVGTDGNEITDPAILDKVNAAKVEQVKDVQISAVDPKTGEPKAPTTIGNVQSTLVATNPEAIKDPNKTAGDIASTAMTGDSNAEAGTIANTGLLKAEGSVLNNAATIRDLQTVANAGLTFQTNNLKEEGNEAGKVRTVHKALGETLNIEGKSGATYSDSDYSFDNMVTTVDRDIVRIGMKKAPEFTSITLKNGTEPDTNTVTLTPGKDTEDGTTTLTLNNGKDSDNTGNVNTSVKITNVAAGTDANDAVNVSQLNNLKEKVGAENAVSSKTDKTPGAAGKDGLDGKDLGTQIAAIREGEAGSMVYTDGEGNRVVKDGDKFYTKDSLAGTEKAADGTYYNIDELAKAGAKIVDGKVVDKDGKEITDQTILDKVNEAKVEPKSVESKDVQISAVDPKTGEPKAPTTIGNVKSTIGLDGNVGTDGKTPVIGEDQAKTNVSNLVKGDSKTSLNTVATVGDLQAVAQAGLDFKGNTGDAIHKALGSTLLIKGEENANFDDGSFESKNLATKNDNGTLRIGMKKTPTFDGVKVSNGTNTVELKPGEEANTLTLTNGTDGDNSAIKVTNVAAGSNDTDAVNYSQLKDLIDKVGAENTNAGTDGKSPSTNPSGNDGLDGKDMGSQIQAIRDGEAGPMVYTDGEGNRVVKDGNTYYKKSDLVGMEKAGDSYYNIEALEKTGAKIVDGQIVNADGKVLEGDELKKVQDAAKVTTMPKAVDAKDVQISTVDPKTGEPKAPTTIGNVKSNYGYDGIGENAEGVTKAIDAAHAKTAMDGEDGKSGLLNAKGADLNKVVTVGDLQAAAQAGLDFTTNDKVTDTAGTIHKALGSALAIEGKSGATYKDTEYGFDNMVTTIDGDKVRIGMKKAPEFTGVTLKDGTDSNANTVILTPGKDTNNRTTLNLTNGTDGKDNQVKITNIAAGTDANDAVNYSQLQNLDNQVKELQNGENGPMVYTDGEGNRLVKSGDTLYKASDVKASDLVTNDGTHYDATSLPEGAKLSDDGTTVVSKDGSAISEDELSKAKLTPVTSNVQISAVNLTTGEPKEPTTIGNVKSTIGLDGNVGTNGKTPVIGEDQAKTNVDKLVKGDSNTSLNTVATVGDLQAVAQAGLDFTTNDTVTTTAGTIHKTLGSTLAIEGKDGVTYSDTNYSFYNMVTTIDGDKVRIGMKKSPEFTGITLNNISSKVVFAPVKDGAGNTSLKVSNGDTTPDADTRVIIDNIKDGESLNSAVTKGALDKAVEELHNREGVDNGTMVYTHEGKTLDRDGRNFYEKGSIAPDKAEKIGTTFYSKDAMAKDGVTISVEGKVIDKDGNEITNPDILSNYQVKPVDPSTIEISTVDPATGEPKAPQTISSVKSNYGYNGIGTELNDKGEKVPAKGANTFITKGDAQKAMGSVDKDGKVISEGLLTAKGADLNKVATVGDLQAAAQAGLDFSTNNDKDNKEQTIHRALGSKLSIKGKLDRQYSADYDSDNLVTTVADDNTIQIAMLRKPAFEGITVENGTDGGSGKVDITAVPVNGKDATEGMTINLAGKDGKNGTAGNNGDIRISGVADGVSGNDAVNYSQLKDLIDKVGAVNANAGSDAKSPANTPAGQDGLDGKDMGSQIQAIRDGEAGPMVYTDKDGNRLVNDGGTYYKKSDLAGMEKAGDSYYNTEALEKAGAKIVGGRIVNADGKVLEGDELKKVQDAAKVTTMPKAVNANDVQISTVDPKTGEPKAPTTIGNVKSNYGYNGIGTEADGKTPAKGIVNAITPKDAKTAMNGAKDTDGTVTGGLLNAKGADLNKVVTVGDLQAAAQAGLDFTGNSYTTTHDDEKNQDVKTLDTAHTTLGGTIAIQGGTEYNANDFSDKNISTKVDPKTKTISINIKKNPEFDSVILGQPGENGQPDKQVTISTANGNEVNFTSTHPQDGDTNVVLSGIKDDPARRDTAITRGALEDLGILEGEVGPSHIAGSDVGGNLSNGDNLNDYSLTKQVQAQREGLSGNVVYTDAKGNRLVKAGTDSTVRHR